MVIYVRVNFRPEFFPVLQAPAGARPCAVFGFGGWIAMTKSGWWKRRNTSGYLAVVRTPQGFYLPGGGVEAGESPKKAIEREDWLR